MCCGCGLSSRAPGGGHRFFPVLLANMIVGGVSYVSNLVTSGHEWENGVRARTFSVSVHEFPRVPNGGFVRTVVGMLWSTCRVVVISSFVRIKRDWNLNVYA